MPSVPWSSIPASVAPPTQGGNLNTSVLHRLKAAVSVVLSDLNPRTAAVNSFCSAALRGTTCWNLFQFGSTAQPNPPFLCTNRPCQAQAVQNTTSAESTSAGVQWADVKRGARCRARLTRAVHIPCCRSGSGLLDRWDSPHPTDMHRGRHGGRCNRPRPW